MSALWWAFLKIGFLGFGGGYAMLSLIYSESETLGLSMAQFADLNALDGLIPGPIAINSATYVGQLIHGWPGALVASLAVCVPSMIFVPLYLHYEAKIHDQWVLSAALDGIKPASAGLIIAVAVLLAMTTVLGIDSLNAWRQADIDWGNLIVLGVVFGLDLKFNLNPVVLILLAGVIGALLYYI